MLIFSEKTSSQKHPAMSDQTSGPWDSAGGRHRGFSQMPPPPDLCRASLLVGSSHEAGLGGGPSPLLAIHGALSLHAVCCDPPPKGSQGHGCCPHYSRPPPQSIQPLPASPTLRSLFLLPPVTGQGLAWSGEATAPPKALLSGLEPGAPVCPCACSRIRSWVNGWPPLATSTLMRWRAFALLS